MDNKRSGNSVNYGNSGSPESLADSQRILQALKQARQQLEEIERQKTEPIAIVGMGCRFPGGAKDPEKFWQLLREGKDAIVPIPPERWDVEHYYDPDPEAPGKMYARSGGFLDEVDRFDPEFFGISPREAIAMDPQHRLLLETSWEALENAGIAPESIQGSPAGTFVGICFDDYSRSIFNPENANRIDAYSGLGNGYSIAAGRIAYVLGLRGPTLSLDTSCSSSMLAVHLACESLRAGKCNLALAGGTNAMLSPETTVGFCKLKALAPDGRCKTFDAAANGYSRGEGCGIVVLKRRSDAIAAGDRILALIRGSAANHDGKSNGLTAPNGSAQEEVMRQALETARLKPSQIQYVEAHGTGTPLGDPIEVLALGKVFGEGRSIASPLKIGSVKTNLGHLEGAAGIVSIIKVVLALQNKQIPPHLNFKNPNPHIPWDKLPIVVPTELTPWESPEERRLAGVNSFGMSGTNVHIILESGPSTGSGGHGASGMGQCHPSHTPHTRPLHLLTLSAKRDRALQEMVGRYRTYLNSHADESLADICFTANSGRSHFKHRLALVAASKEELQQQLASFQAGKKEIPGVISAKSTGNKRQKIAFLFTGQGSQYISMGRELYETQPNFRKTLDRCAEILHPYLENSLLEILYLDETNPNPKSQIPNPKLDETTYTQPALFAIEYALAQLWRSWGIYPDAVMGHSIGEYVAACVAGVFSLEDGLKLVAARGRLMQALPQNGEMVAVMADEATVRELVESENNGVAIAAINAPQNIVISGEREAINRVVAILEAAEINATQLNVSHAFHSSLMEPMLAEFEKVASEATFSQPKINLISNVTGEWAKAEIATPQYWCRHVREPVRFADSMETLHRGGYAAFLECGSKPILLAMGRQCLPENVGVWLPSLGPGRSDWQLMLQSLGELYGSGAAVDWSGFDSDYPRAKVALPTYPFQRERYWVENGSGTSPQSPISPYPHQYHPLLGQRLRSPVKETIFYSALQPKTPAFLKDHRIFEKTVLPATAYLEMALAAGVAKFQSEYLTLEDVAIERALILPDAEIQTVQLILAPGSASSSFQIYSPVEGQGESGSDWKQHASGKISKIRVTESNGQTENGQTELDLEQLRALFTDELSVEAAYEQFTERGIDYGFLFQAIERLWRRPGEALARILLPEELVREFSSYQLHPVLLDACFQTAIAIFDNSTDAGTYLPVGLERLHLYRRPEIKGWSHVRVRPDNGSSGNTLTLDLRWLDESGALAVQLDGLFLKRVNPELLLGTSEKSWHNWLYEVQWRPQSSKERERSLSELPPTGEIDDASAPKHWLIFGDRAGIGEQLTALLRSKGDSCTLVFPDREYRESGQEFRLDPDKPTDFQRMLEAIKTNNSPLAGIVHLWSLDTPIASELTDAQLEAASKISCGSTLHLIQALVGAMETLPRLWSVTRGAQAVTSNDGLPGVAQSSLWGMGKVIALEYPELKYCQADLDPNNSASDSAAAVFQEIGSDSEDNHEENPEENQLAFRAGNRYVSRLIRYGHSQEYSQEHSQDDGDRLNLPESESFRLEIPERGILENLTLMPAERRQPGAGEVEILVRATGLNFRDVLNALDLYPGEAGPLGGECAGEVVRIGEGVAGLEIGNAVVALAPASFSKYVTVDASLVARSPLNLDFSEAATIPINFLTAYYSLHHLARISPGDRVLIHAAAGGTGMAAVLLAQQAGAEVFATASPGKWAFLKSMGVRHIANSRTLDFAEEVMTATQGEGVDIVFNSLTSGEFIAKSISVLKPQGRFLELGKRDVWDSNQITQVKPEASYFIVDLVNLTQQQPALIQTMLRSIVQQFDSGRLQPLPQKIFPLPDAVSAFRYMQQAKHIGKIVLTQPPASDPEPLIFHSDRTYMITGGLGDLGLLVARSIVERGARHLVLVGRSGAKDSAKRQLAELERMGAEVALAKADVSDGSQIARVLADIDASDWPLGGIIHAVGVLDDGILLNQTWERFQGVMAPKVRGAWNLHTLTQKHPLDFFVMFSSAASLIGNAGQSNYAAANAFLDALAYYRRAMGLAGTSINWGAWSEVGMFARSQTAGKAQLEGQMKSMGAIAPERGLQVLAKLLAEDVTQVGVLPISWSQLFQQLPTGVAPAFFSELTDGIEPGEQQSESDAPKGEFLRHLQEVPESERHALLTTYLTERVAKVFRLSPERVDLHTPLNEMGLDSLMGVELRNRVNRDLNANISAVKFLEGGSIAELSALILDELGATPEEAVVETVVTDGWEEIEL